MYGSYYCKHPCFLSLSQTFEKAETHFFTMSIKNSTIDSDLKNEEAVKFKAQTNSKSKEWSSFLCVLALASVIKKNIFLYLSEVPLHFLFCKLGEQRLHEKIFFKLIILSH